MIIEFDDYYHLKVNVDKVPDKQVYQLSFTKMNPNNSKLDSTQDLYFNPSQLKQVVDYLMKVTHDII